MSQKTDHDKLVDEIHAFLARVSIRPATFGRIAFKDPSFVRDIMLGKRRLRPSTMMRMRVAMARFERGDDGPQPVSIPASVLPYVEAVDIAMQEAESSVIKLRKAFSALQATLNQRIG